MDDDVIVMDDFLAEEAGVVEEKVVDDEKVTEEEDEVVVEDLKKGTEGRLEELQQQLMDLSLQTKQLKAENEELKRDVRGKGELPREEKELTDADLLAIMDQHKDDHGVLLRVFKHVSETAAQRIANEKAEETVKDQSYKAWADRMDQITTSVLQADQRVKDNKFNQSVQRVVKEFSLTGHPAAEMLGAAVVTYAQLLAGKEGSGEAGKKGGGDAEKKPNPVSLGKKGEIGSGGGKKAGEPQLTKEQLDFCRQQGLDPKTYAKFVR